MNLIIGRKLHTGGPISSDHSPMEVDALKGWKSKGESKGKDDGGKYGKGGETKDGKTRFEGTCNLCGKTGHKKEDCWHNKSGEKGKSEKGKGKGKQDHKGKGRRATSSATSVARRVTTRRTAGRSQSRSRS